jgi:hypothetical protein
LVGIEFDRILIFVGFDIGRHSGTDDIPEKLVVDVTSGGLESFIRFEEQWSNLGVDHGP